MSEFNMEYAVSYTPVDDFSVLTGGSRGGPYRVFVGSTGDVYAVPVLGRNNPQGAILPVVFKNVPSGTTLPVYVTAIYQSLTTATNLVVMQ